MAKYSFGETTFSNQIGISGTRMFYNPTLIEFELETRSSVNVLIYSTSGYEGHIEFSTGSNWKSRSLTYLPRGKSYRFVLQNRGSGTVVIKHGNLHYNPLVIA